MARFPQLKGSYQKRNEMLFCSYPNCKDHQELAWEQVHQAHVLTRFEPYSGLTLNSHKLEDIFQLLMNCLKPLTLSGTMTLLSLSTVFVQFLDQW